jgi:ABC-2 type transport system permease protein
VQKTVLLSIPLVFLAGFMFPIRNMPLPFRVFAELIPATHYIRIARGIYLRAEGFVTLLPEIAIVLAFGAVLVGVAFRTVGART